MSTTVIPISRAMDEAAPVSQPAVPAPSILGLYGFAAATFMVAAHMAHWFGGALTDFYLVPFAAVFGGVAQFCAGMWAYKAKDGVGTAMHGTLGLVLDRLWAAAMGHHERNLAPPAGRVSCTRLLVHRIGGDYLGRNLGSVCRK
jgi:succinate-acetate transporter protein